MEGDEDPGSRHWRLVAEERARKEEELKPLVSMMEEEAAMNPIKLRFSLGRTPP